MNLVWSLRTKYDLWKEVELALLQVKMNRGMITPAHNTAISSTVDFDVARITQLDEGPGGFHHDLLAFVASCKETLGARGVKEEAIAEFHRDVTSYDIEDSAFSLQLQQAGKHIIDALRALRSALYERALEHRLVPMVGMTHGQAADVISLGVKLLNYVDIVDRDVMRVESALKDVRVGRLAGAVGGYGHLGPEIERDVCEILGLATARISTQIIHRDRHAHLFQTLVLVACNIEHIDHNLWLMCQFPRLEAREPFNEKQRGSSAMPHKRNPHKIERVRGMATLIRGYGAPIMENVTTFDERAIDQSCVERVAWADGMTLLHYMLKQMHDIVRNMKFFPEKMQQNIDITLGLLGSSYVKDLLLGKNVENLRFEGVPQDVYTWVQSCAFRAYEVKTHLKTVLIEHGIRMHATDEEIEDCFDTMRALKHVGDIFERFEVLTT